MKIKTKILNCLGTILWLTVAILPGSASAAVKATTIANNYTTDPLSFQAKQQSALEWCDRGFKKQSANCCAKHANDAGRPGRLVWIDKGLYFPFNLIVRPHWACQLID